MANGEGRGPQLRRGEIWLADVPGDKARPVLVLTRDPMGGVLHSVICAPVTARIRSIGTEVPLGTGDGMQHDSVANLDNTMLLPRANFRHRIGQAGTEVMVEACRALALATGCG